MSTLIQPKPNWKHKGKAPLNLPGEVYTWGIVTVFVGIEAGKWHLSISTPHRNPTWEEIKAARYEFCPHDVTMAMILPPTEEYVNIHNFCFHLHEIENDG